MKKYLLLILLIIGSSLVLSHMTSTQSTENKTNLSSESQMIDPQNDCDPSYDTAKSDETGCDTNAHHQAQAMEDEDAP